MQGAKQVENRLVCGFSTEAGIRFQARQFNTWSEFRLSPCKNSYPCSVPVGFHELWFLFFLRTFLVLQLGGSHPVIHSLLPHLDLHVDISGWNIYYT